MEKQTSESFRLGALLAVAGGILDAYTYLVRGGVFANAQTGNIVLLGVRLIQGQWAQVLHYLIPILAFAVGVIVAELIKQRFRYSGGVHWRQLTVGLELILLAVVAFLPSSLDSLANVAVSFVCAVQVESFRKVNGNAFATTMCTGNLRSGTERLFLYLKSGERDHWARAVQYYGIILCFIAGAALGALCAGAMGQTGVLISLPPLIIAFVMMFEHKDLAGTNKPV
ncbi:YoaK family protein [Intestinimonas massiliensis (ex Afouda et al. 2020)]|uniref:YoaK family protein n=1 Tax=Intestinimonas massiliensis (ex Afouda et al. 2020) TaxID=1673721 RepID=UPI001031C0F0|nr:YoaK family protein [Intestinimonas massiliensis (ex Afouda et al. 2020)]